MERKDISLNNGVTMPPIGYGVFRMTDLDECENAVVQAVKECNAYFQREDKCKYLKEQNILMQAWSPIAAGKAVTEFLEKANQYHV